jgi:hypothetical protein
MRNFSKWLGFLLLPLCMACASGKNTQFSQDAGYGSAPSSRSSGSTSSGTAGSTRFETKNSRVGSKNSAFTTAEQARKEFEERMEANAKRYKKEAKLAEKPQYSDPSYFGHKKKPKKRPLKRRKLCKECGIVH